MNKLNINDFKKVKDYLIIENEGSKVVFSTAEENRSFNRHTNDGIENLMSIKKDFNVMTVSYLKQIHSDKILIINEENIDNINESEGDAIITNLKNIAIGVFTADCVPIILVDEKKRVSAAIHSGWKGTFSSITLKTIKKLQDIYGSNLQDIKAYIGTHIRQCCYEVSEELKEKFIEEKDIDKDLLFKGRNLSMEECILKNLRDSGVKEENIYSLPLCTHCSEEIKLYSYRKSKGLYGRMFSFVILN